MQHSGAEPNVNNSFNDGARNSATIGPALFMSSPPQYPRGKHSFEHVEVSGRRIVVEHIDRRTRTFLERAEALTGQDATKPEAVRAFVFGPENPILATHPTLPGAYPDAATIKTAAGGLFTSPTAKFAPNAAGSARPTWAFT